MTPTTAHLVHEVIDGLLAESADDFIGLWEIPVELTWRLPDADVDQLRRLGEEVVHGLVDGGLLIGDLCEHGFVPWEDPTDVDRVMVGWDALGRLPNIGDVCSFDRPA